MFGDMFEEAEGPVQGPLIENASKLEAPPPLRGETRFCGIKNQGATCYLNSLIQTLLLTPEFREQLFRLGPDELGKLDDVKKKSAKVRIIPIHLQMLLARLLLLDQYACGTEGLTESFGWVDNEEMQQHDVQELGRILFCAIEDSLVGTSGHEIIKNLFRGVIANKTTCLSCKKVSERPEEFLDLNIAIATQSTLCAVLHDMFIETELMSGKNQYHCDQCAKLTDARKGAVIKTLPPVLTVSLLRFAFDYSTFRRFKETRKFAFPLTLNMRSYCETGKNQISCYDYDLYSVIIHSGGAHGGHYHAYIRDVDGIGTVPHDYDPTPKKPPPPMTSLSPEDDHLEDPLEAVTTILGRLGGENVPLNKLGDAFREECGTSWSKQCKRKYGTMIKFLRNNYEIFTVDSRAKTVSFRSGSSSFDQPNFDDSMYSNCDSSYTEFESGDSFSRKDESSQGNVAKENGEEVGDKSEKTLDKESDYHPLCDVWFDFNDSNVKAITTHDIETQFEGRESAYMLFYRRRDLKRPLVSLGNAVDSIPGHILAQIQKENSDLQLLRNEYDVYLNVVTIQVFLPSMFKFENGLLKLAEPQISEPGFSYSIDRRKTIAEFYSDMLEMVEKHTETELLQCKEDLHCNIVDVLGHGGFQIYDQVDKDKTTVISDSLLENDKKVILWNGVDIQGREVSPGKEFEAKILNVHCKIDGDSEISCVDYKGVAMGNITIDKLRQYFLGNFQLKCVTSGTIFAIEDSGSLSELLSNEAKICDIVSSCQGNLMLKICLKEEDGHKYEDKNEETLTLNVSLTETFDEKLTGSNESNTSNDVFTLTSMSCVVKVSSFLFVEHLKSKIPRWLYPRIQTPPELEHVNVCMENEDSVGSLALSKLSLHEQQSLSNAGLSKTASVQLDVGEPLNTDLIHIAVCVQKSSKLKLPVKKCQFVKIDCNKTQSVLFFIEKIISELKLQKDPYQYHLRMLKSEKEVGDIITNPNVPISKTQIHHGCAVILCPGCVSTEGQLRVPILFYPNLISFDDLRNRIRDIPGLSPWCPFLNEKDIQPSQAGYVSIDKDSTVFDLKQEVIELEYFKSLDLTSPEKICLRSVSDKAPTKFHLQDNAMIKRLRLGPTTPLAVSRITCVPQDGYTALRLSFNIPGTRIYANDCELQWEKAANLSQFPARLADIFKVPLKEVLMAKHGEEPWEWEIVKTRDAETKDKNAQKGKKSSKQKKVPNKPKTKKPSTKLSPQDGDLLRIKRIVPNIDNAPDVTDFRSEEELALYSKWQESRQKESNMQLKVDVGAEEDIGKKAKSKKEETLHIHVDKF